MSQDRGQEKDSAQRIESLLLDRFGERLRVDPDLTGLEHVESIVKHRVIRRYSARPVDEDLLRLICACALSAPAKSDLQQRDIVIVRETHTRAEIAALFPDMPWIGQAPCFLVFVANGRRLPALAAARGKPFPNDHLDQLFNATTDAAMALGNAIMAAGAVGLGCCPISVIRDHADRMSELLALPDRVIPVAGLCLGWPADPGRLSPRLPLALTLHQDRFDDEGLLTHVEAYDARRNALGPYRTQRDTARWGESDRYGWSEDKVRQYAVPQRADFGDYVRRRGFSTD
jgi:nitroreductase